MLLLVLLRQISLNYTKSTDPAVSLDGFNERSKRIALQHDSVWMIGNEVEVLESGAALGSLGTRRPPFVGAALQVVLLVVIDRRRQQVVHYDKPNVLPTTLHCTHSCLSTVLD